MQSASSSCRVRESSPRQRGQATVELALSIGLLLFILLAAIDFGRAFFAYVGLVNAAREGARAGVMALDVAAIEPAARQEIAGNNLDPARLNVLYTWGGSSHPLVVTTQYQFNLVTTGFLPVSTINMQASASMAIP